MDLNNILNTNCEVIRMGDDWIYPIFKNGWNGFRRAKEESKFNEQIKEVDNLKDQEREELRNAERQNQPELAQRRRRESALVLRLALKEREARDLQTQVRELRQAMRPAPPLASWSRPTCRTSLRVTHSSRVW